MWRYYAFRLAGFSLSLLPVRAGYFVAGVIADIIYILAPGVRQSIADNQRRIVSTKLDKASLNRLVRSVLRSTACNYFDLVKLPRLKRRDLETMFSVAGQANLEAAFSKGKGVVLLTAHLGSYDMAAQWLALHSIKTTALVEPINPPPLLDHVTKLRRSHGVSFLPSQAGTLGALFKCLHRGEALLFASDRDIDQNGIRMNFFGAETTLPTIAVRFAMKTGAALVPVFSRRAGTNCEITFEPAIELAAASHPNPLAANVEKAARVMEKHIARDPGQWVVLSRVWPEPAAGVIGASQAAA